MKIFYVAPASPWPLSFGGSMRVAGVLAALERCGDVELAVLADEPGPAARQWLAERGATLWAAPPESAMGRSLRIAGGALSGRSIPAARLFHGSVREELRAAASRADVVVLGDTYAADAIESLAGLTCHVVVDTHNIESLLWRDTAAISPTVAERVLYGLLARNSAALERRVLPLAHDVWTTSEDDAEWYRRELGLASVRVVPNALVECGPLLPEGDGETVMMSGHFAYPPNEDAALLLLAASRELETRGVRHRMCLVGRGPGRRLYQAAEGLSHVEITGEVADIGPWMHRAAVFAAPLRAGSGTKFKLLQAMAAGRPVVTTPAGARGLGLVDNRHARIVDAREFASGVAALLADGDTRTRMAGEARRHVEEHFLQRNVNESVTSALAGF